MKETLLAFVVALVSLDSVASFVIYGNNSRLDSSKVGLIGTQATNKTITDETLRALLGKIKDYVTPVQTIPDEAYFTNTSELCANVSSKNVEVTDLTVYSIDVAHVDMSKLEFFFKLTFPSVNLSGIYHLYVENELLVLRGHGNFNDYGGRMNCKPGQVRNGFSSESIGTAIRATFSTFGALLVELPNILHLNLSLSTNLTLTQNAQQTMEMKNVSTDFDLSYAHVNFDNLGEDKDVSVFLNDFINQFIVESMKSLKPDVNDEIGPRLMNLGNFAVQGMTLDEFIDFINGLV